MYVKETKSVRNKCATGVTMAADRQKLNRGLIVSMQETFKLLSTSRMLNRMRETIPRP